MILNSNWDYGVSHVSISKYMYVKVKADCKGDKSQLSLTTPILPVGILWGNKGFYAQRRYSGLIKGALLCHQIKAIQINGQWGRQRRLTARHTIQIKGQVRLAVVFDSTPCKSESNGEGRRVDSTAGSGVWQHAIHISGQRDKQRGGQGRLTTSHTNQQAATYHFLTHRHSKLKFKILNVSRYNHFLKQ